MRKNKETKRAIPVQMTDDDDVLPHYDIDYSKAKPNRFAGRKLVIIGPVSEDGKPLRSKRSSAKQGTARSRKPVIAKRVYLYPSQVKLLARIDKNFSAAVRKVIDKYQA